MIDAAPTAELSFQVCSYQAIEGGRSYRRFEMTRDGITLLAMGFTGKNRITPAIRKPAVPARDPTASRLPAS
jgi:hypothetical protein